MKKRMTIVIISFLMTAFILNNSYLTSFSHGENTYIRKNELISFDATLTESASIPLRYYESIPVRSLQVCNLSSISETDSDYTEWWYSEWEDCRYIFLPSSADRNNLIINYSADEIIYLNNEPITSGASTSVLNKADEFEIRVGTTDCGTLKIYHSLFQFIQLLESRHWKLRASKESRELEKSIYARERKSCTFSKKHLKES